MVPAGTKLAGELLKLLPRVGGTAEDTWRCFSRHCSIAERTQRTRRDCEPMLSGFGPDLTEAQSRSDGGQVCPYHKGKTGDR